MREDHELGFGRVAFEMLVGHSSKSVQGLAGRALSLGAIPRMEINIRVPSSMRR